MRTKLLPSQRVLLVTIVAVLGGLVLVGATILTLQPADDAARQLPERILPADRALDAAVRGISDSQALFVEALSSADPATKTALTTQAQEASDTGSKHWTTFKQLEPASGEPAVRRLIGEYDAASTEARSLGATAFSIDQQADPAAFTAALDAQKAQVARQLAIVDEIERRFIQPEFTGAAATAATGIDDTVRNVLIAFAVVLIVGLTVAISTYRSARRDERLQAHERREHQRDNRRADLEMQLQRGLEMEPSEEATFEVIHEALVAVAPGVPAELMLADSSRAHFRQVTATEDGGPGCPVGTPRECPATATGQLQLFVDSKRLDACPHLRVRGDEPLWGICAPVSIAGRANGVLHVAAPVGTTIPDEAIQELELIGRKAGDRIGALRVLARSEQQAQIDALSGLWNRRTLDERARELVLAEEPFCIAFADLDNFKDVNDAHGHEIGDRALRLFSRVLRDSVRPNDLPGRYGGEEFVVVLPDCSLGDARIVAERIQRRLADSLRGASVPSFTVSLGLAQRGPGEAFVDAVRRADEAMLKAKGDGRNRIITSTGLAVVEHPEAEGAEGAT
jgi:diguanylate cyclase (GGDEF)-like protein